MSNRIKRNAPHLKLLSKAKPTLAKAILKNATPDLLAALCECCLNILKGNVPLTPAQKKRLSRHKNNLRLLIKKKTSNKKRRQILQAGGFLPLLAPLLAPIVGGLVKSIF